VAVVDGTHAPDESRNRRRKRLHDPNEHENNQYGVETLPGGLPPADTSNSGRK
jgi:hypothetical protein